MNNNFFSIKRLGLLFRKDIQENWKKYLMYIATLYGALTIILTIIVQPNVTFYESGNFHNQNLLSMTCILLFIFGLVFASTMMSPMNNKTKRISFLSNPSSLFEKFFYRWLFITIGYIIIFLVTIHLADATRVAIHSFRFPEIDIPFIDFSKMYGENGEAYEYLATPKIFMMFTFFYFFLQALFTLGTTFWAKNSLIKTFSACLIIVVSYVFIINTFGSLLLSTEKSFAFDQALSFLDKNSDTFSPESLLSIIFFFFTIIFWILSYFRFKESEIINRW